MHSSPLKTFQLSFPELLKPSSPKPAAGSIPPAFGPHSPLCPKSSRGFPSGEPSTIAASLISHVTREAWKIQELPQNCVAGLWCGWGATLVSPPPPHRAVPAPASEAGYTASGELASQQVKAGYSRSPDQHLGLLGIIIRKALLQFTGIFSFCKLTPDLAKPFPLISVGNDLL